MVMEIAQAVGDTGFVVALLNKKDDKHYRSKRFPFISSKTLSKFAYFTLKSYITLLSITS